MRLLPVPKGGTSKTKNKTMDDFVSPFIKPQARVSCQIRADYGLSFRVEILEGFSGFSGLNGPRKPRHVA